MSEGTGRTSAAEPPRPRSLGLARVLVGLGRGVSRVLPHGIRRRLEDRVFYSVFQITRVTNDSYGWRPGDDE